MRDFVISKRMEAVAELVPLHASTVADIGCDHAYVPIKLIRNNMADRVIAMDVRKGPLETAKHNICEYGVEDRIELRLSDGMEKLLQKEAEAIIIAGMGGLLIKRILEKGIHLLICEDAPALILQPQSDIREVRIFLYEHSYHIVRETMIYEDGKYYTAILACPGYEAPYDKEEDWEYGGYNIAKHSSVLTDYLENEAEVFMDILSNLEAAGNADDNISERTLNRINEIKHKQRINNEAYRRCVGADEMRGYN